MSMLKSHCFIIITLPCEFRVHRAGSQLKIDKYINARVSLLGIIPYEYHEVKYYSTELEKTFIQDQGWR